MNIELLNNFCAKSKDDPRTYLYKPFLIGEYIYATNGHVAIRVKNDGSLPEVAEIDKVKTISNYFQSLSSDFIDIPSIPNPEPCKHCQGSGKWNEKIECDECDGDGEFIHGSHYYSCKECDGEGKIETGNKVGICDSCEGSGHSRMQHMQIGIASFAVRYIIKISALPGIKFCKPIHQNDIATFVFDGGEGCIMPVRT